MESKPIHQLPAALVNRIAAGEVIERPASVVKELVENAIDAGATSITIETEDGGRELIRVIDNGCGMPPTDLGLAFAEHATSKLSCDEDLGRISTMGFRGEALASIGAVSQSRILSRTAESDAAWEILNRGGEISPVQAAAGNVGTVVEVRNLFYNTPARRKFLRGASTESGQITEMVTRLALPHPGIAFKLISGARTVLDLPAGEAEERLLAAWPAEFREQRLRIDARDAEVQVKGLVGMPELAHPTARYQYLYLNGRHIRDKFILHAVREAYRGLMEPGRNPAAILLLTIPAADVDVNVHPTKAEVRFRDSGRIHGLVNSALRERLLGSNLTPRALPRAGGDDGQPRADLRQTLADFFKAPPPSPTASIEWPTAPPQPTRPVPGIQRIESSDPYHGRPARADEGTGETPVLQGTPNPQSAIRNPQSSSTLQLHNSYLVTQTDEGLVIIDQHALHERILYEELLARLTRGPLESQRLLIPELVPANQEQIDLLQQITPMLAKLGIEISVFGPESVAVQAFPTFLSKLQPGEFVADLLERGQQELLDLHEEELLHEILEMMACKAAVKAGDPLTAPEIDALLSRRELVDRTSNCPHGRPTTLRLSLADLEKQFKRTGF